VKIRILTVILIIAFPLMLHAKSKGTTAIIVATDSELKAVMSQMKSLENKTSDGVIFMNGTLNDQTVIVARSNPGKINATYTTTMLFDKFNPDKLIMIGLAGALNPKIKAGATFIASRVIEHDFGELIGGTFGTMQSEGIDTSRFPLFNLAMSRALNQNISLMPAILLTGDTFISNTAKRNQLRNTYGGDIVDMEGYAVAKVCELKAKDCAILRVVSDSADEKAHKTYEAAKSSFDAELVTLLKTVIEDPVNEKEKSKKSR
jgi:adenosylhomocysteine nucleosidase